MPRHTQLAPFFAIAALVAVGCATDRFDAEPLDPSDGGVSLSGLAALSPSCGADAGAGLAACSGCLLAQCSAEYAACFGPAFQAGTPGGLCGDLGSCALRCMCGDSACYEACLSGTLGAGCTSCLEALMTCRSSRCAAECVSGVSGDGGSVESGPPDEAGAEGGSEAGAGQGEAGRG